MAGEQLVASEDTASKAEDTIGQGTKKSESPGTLTDDVASALGIDNASATKSPPEYSEKQNSSTLQSSETISESPPNPSSAADPAENPQSPEPKSECPKVKVPDVFFCFGQKPGQYLFKSPDDLIYNMPIELANILEEGPIERIFSASVGKDGAAWIYFEGADGRKCQYRSSTLIKKYPKLEKWIKKSIDKGDSPLMVTFGSGDAYAACSTTKSKFVAEGFQSISENLNKMESCDMLTLGWNYDSLCQGTTHDKKYMCYLKAENINGWYKIAYKIGQGDGIMHIEFPPVYGPNADRRQLMALNPRVPGQFFLLSRTGEAHYYVDASYQVRLETALKKCGFKCFPYGPVSGSKAAGSTPSQTGPVTVEQLDQALQRFDHENKRKRRAEAAGIGMATGVITALACSVM